MAGGKLTPRQKMINMMYLVLTALLAMNVSAEILNAFKTVNNSIVNSNNIITGKNNDTYAGFEAAAKDPQTAEKAARWKVYAEKAKALSDDIYSKIEAVKDELKKGSGLEMVDGEEVYKYDDLEAPTRILIEEKKGETLYTELNAYKSNLMKVLNPEDFNDNPSIKEQVVAKLKEFEHTLPLSIEIPKSSTGEKYTQDAKGWTEGNFHMTPTVAAVTILSKIQNDIRSSESQIADYCFGQIGKVKLVYDAFAAIASANTNYAMPGDPIEIVAGIGAFSKAAQPTITIGGQVMPLDANGQAIYKTTASGGGQRSVPVKISYTTPDGKQEVVEKTITYTVGTPSGAAVQFDKMNVIYIGVDNPLTIKSSKGDEKTTVSISGGGASLSKQGAGKFIAKATTPTNDAIITVTAEGESNKFPVRVKMIPDPIATIGGNEPLTSSGKGGKANLKAQGAVIPLLKNFDFDARFTVISYDFYLKTDELIPARDNSGPYFSGAVNALFDRAKPNDVVIFDNIKVKGPDGSTRKIPNMTFTII